MQERLVRWRISVGNAGLGCRFSHSSHGPSAVLLCRSEQYDGTVGCLHAGGVISEELGQHENVDVQQQGETVTRV